MSFSKCGLGCVIGIFVISPLFLGRSDAFELETHRQLSLNAFQASELASNAQFKNVVSQSTSDGRFRGRLGHLQLMRRTPEEWIVRGGVGEDFPVWRVLNHFYDPEHGTGLDILGSLPAPDWGLEDTASLDGQEYSYKDALQAFYDGLTSPSSGTRERELGHAFLTLGHVIHLIQDMAQPQHTRNDLHFFIGPTASFLERYLDKWVGEFTLRGAPIPEVVTPRDLWFNEGESGLARFSNRNFVSAGTNFTELRTGATAEHYPSPELDLTRFSSSSLSDRCEDGATAPGGDRVPLIFYGNSFSDPVTGHEIVNDRMTTHSIFDQYLQAHDLRLIFALNCFNIDRIGEILLPRAVSYSAALLKHFFRGQLEARYTGYLMAITNRTPGEAMDGAFELYYDAADGTRVRLARWLLALQPDAESPLLALPPVPPAAPAASPGRYLLVFRGRLGAEADAVAGTWLGGSFGVAFDRLDSTGSSWDYSVAAPFAPAPHQPLWLFAIHSEEVNPYGPAEPFSAERQQMTAIYRDLATLPGDRLQVTAYSAGEGECLRRIVTAVSPLDYENTYSHATADLVEFSPPPSTAALDDYRWPGPPVIRVLASINTESPGTFELDATGIRFIGLVLTSPVPPGGGYGSQNSCGVAVTIQFE